MKTISGSRRNFHVAEHCFRHGTASILLAVVLFFGLFPAYDSALALARLYPVEEQPAPIFSGKLSPVLDPALDQTPGSVNTPISAQPEQTSQAPATPETIANPGTLEPDTPQELPQTTQPEALPAQPDATTGLPPQNLPENPIPEQAQQPTPQTHSLLLQEPPPAPPVEATEKKTKTLPATAPSEPQELPATETSQTPPKATAPAKKNIRLFGTVEFKGKTNSLPAWNEMLERHKRNDPFKTEGKIGRITLEAMQKHAETLSPLEKLRYVNTYWNQWPYRLDPNNYKKEDYWASPSEFIKNSGDCEDYSIAKYFTLKALGFPVEDMRIVILNDTIRNLAHAVLLVFLNDTAYVLDNMSNSVLPHTRYTNYQPQISINEQFRWAHVRLK